MYAYDCICCLCVPVCAMCDLTFQYFRTLSSQASSSHKSNHLGSALFTHFLSMKRNFRGTLAPVLDAGFLLLFYFCWGDGREVVTWVSDTCPSGVSLSVAEVFSFPLQRSQCGLRCLHQPPLGVSSVSPGYILYGMRQGSLDRVSVSSL